MANLDDLVRRGFSPERVSAIAMRDRDTDLLRQIDRRARQQQKDADRAAREEKNALAQAERERRNSQREQDQQNKADAINLKNQAIAWFTTPDGRHIPITSPSGGSMKQYDKSGVLWDSNTGKPYKLENGQLRDASDDGSIVTKDGSVYRVDKGQPWKWIGYDKGNIQPDKSLTSDLALKTQQVNEAASAATGIENAITRDIASDRKRLKEIDDEMFSADESTRAALTKEKEGLTAGISAKEERQAQAELASYRAQTDKLAWSEEKARLIKENTDAKRELSVDPKGFPNTGRLPDASRQTGIGSTPQQSRESTSFDPMGDFTERTLRAFDEQTVRISGNMVEHTRQVVDAMSQPDVVGAWTKSAMAPKLAQDFADRTAVPIKLPEATAKATGLTYAPESWFTPEAMDRQLTAKLAGQDKVKLPTGYRVDGGTIYAPQDEPVKLFGVQLPWLKTSKDVPVGHIVYDDFGVGSIQMNQDAKISPSFLSQDYYHGLPEYASPSKQFEDSFTKAPAIGSQVVDEVRKEAMAAFDAQGTAEEAWKSRRWSAGDTRDFLNQWQTANDAKRAELIAQIDPRQAGLKSTDRKLDGKFLYDNGFVSAQDARLLNSVAYGQEPGMPDINTAFDAWAKTSSEPAAKILRDAWATAKKKDTASPWKTLLNPFNISTLTENFKNATNKFEDYRLADVAERTARSAFASEYFQKYGNQVDFDRSAFSAARDALVKDVPFSSWAIGGVASLLQTGGASSVGMAAETGKVFLGMFGGPTAQESNLIGMQTDQTSRGLEAFMRDRNLSYGDILAMFNPLAQASQITSIFGKLFTAKDVIRGESGGQITDGIAALRSMIDRGNYSQEEWAAVTSKLRGAGDKIATNMGVSSTPWDNDILDPRSGLGRYVAAYMETADPAYLSTLAQNLKVNKFDRQVNDIVSDYSSAGGTITESSRFGVWNQSLVGGSVAPLQELGTEVASNLFSAGLGKTLAVGGKMAQSSIRAGRALSALERAVVKIDGLAGKFAEFGNVARKPGMALTTGQAAWNTGLTLTKAVVGDSVSEFFEEAFMGMADPGSSIYDVAGAGVIGALTGIGMGGTMSLAGAAGGKVSQSVLESVNLKGLKAYVADWNARNSEAPITIDQVLQAQDYASPAAREEIYTRTRDLLAERNAIEKQLRSTPGPSAVPNGRGGTVTSTPLEWQALNSRLAKVKNDLYVSTLQSKGLSEAGLVAVQEVQGLPEAERQIVDGILKVASGTVMSPQQEQAVLQAVSPSGQSLTYVKNGKMIVSEAGRSFVKEQTPNAREFFLTKTETQQLQSAAPLEIQQSQKGGVENGETQKRQGQGGRQEVLTTQADATAGQPGGASSTAAATTQSADAALNAALQAAIPFHQANKSQNQSAGDAWFEGARVNEAARNGFTDALNSGGQSLQAHGMGKEATLSGGIKNLVEMLKNGLDMNRRGGRLDTAPLVANAGEGLVGATASGSAYNDGPFMLVARPGENLSGDLSGLGAVLVNEANADILPQIRAALQAVRPGLIVESYANAGNVTRELLAPKTATSTQNLEPAGAVGNPGGETATQTPIPTAPAPSPSSRYSFDVTYLPIGAGTPITVTHRITAVSPEIAATKRDAILLGVRRLGTVQSVTDLQPMEAKPLQTDAPPQNNAFVPAANTSEWTSGAIRSAISNAAAAFGYRIVDTGLDVGINDRYGNAVNLGTQLYDKLNPGSEIGQWIDAMAKPGTKLFNEIGSKAIENAAAPGLHRVWFGHDFATNLPAIVDKFGWAGVPDYIGQLLKDSLTKSGIPFPGVQLLVQSGAVSDKVATAWLSTNIGEVFGGGVAFFGTYRLALAAKRGNITKPRFVFATLGMGIKVGVGLATAQPFLVLSGLADAAILVTSIGQIKAAFKKGHELAKTSPAPAAVEENSTKPAQQKQDSTPSTGPPSKAVVKESFTTQQPEKASQQPATNGTDGTNGKNAAPPPSEGASDAKTVLSIPSKNRVPILEIQTRKLANGRFQSKSQISTQNAGMGTPFHDNQTYATEAQAIAQAKADVSEYVNRTIGRSDTTAAEKAQLEKIREAVTGVGKLPEAVTKKAPAPKPAKAPKKKPAKNSYEQKLEDRAAEFTKQAKDATTEKLIETLNTLGDVPAFPADGIDLMRKQAIEAELDSRGKLPKPAAKPKPVAKSTAILTPEQKAFIQDVGSRFAGRTMAMPDENLDLTNGLRSPAGYASDSRKLPLLTWRQLIDIGAFEKTTFEGKPAVRFVGIPEAGVKSSTPAQQPSASTVPEYFQGQMTGNKAFTAISQLAPWMFNKNSPFKNLPRVFMSPDRLQVSETKQDGWTPGGVAMVAYDGRILVDFAELVKQLNATPEGDRQAWFEAAIDEELEHYAQQQALNSSELTALWNDAPDAAKQFVVETYHSADVLAAGGDWRKVTLNPASISQEFLRIYRQALKRGATTEQATLRSDVDAYAAVNPAFAARLAKALGDIARWMREELTGLLTGDARARFDDAIARIDAKRKEIEATIKDEKSPSPQQQGAPADQAGADTQANRPTGPPTADTAGQPEGVAGQFSDIEDPELRAALERFDAVLPPAAARGVQRFTPIPPKSLDKAIAYVRRGGRLVVRTSMRVTTIDSATLARFDKAGVPLLREEGDGYRMQNGRQSVFLLPGQLEAEEIVAPAAPAAAAKATPEFISAASQLSDALWSKGYDTPEKFAAFLHSRFADRITPKVLSQVWSLGANTDPDVAVNWSNVHAEAISNARNNSGSRDSSQLSSNNNSFALETSEVAALEGFVNGGILDAKVFSDSAEGKSILTKLNRLIQRPAESPEQVNLNMVPLGDNLKIVDGVIQSIPVFVVNDLLGGELSSKEFLNNDTVFKPLSSDTINLNAYKAIGSIVPGKSADVSTSGRASHAPNSASDSSNVNDTVDETFVAFPESSGTLGIPRADMPQVKIPDRAALLKYLSDRGVRLTETTIPHAKDSLFPSQAEYSESKSERAKELLDTSRHVFISADNYIVDGHHQYVAAGNGPLKVVRIGLPIREAIRAVADFPQAKGGERFKAMSEADALAFEHFTEAQHQELVKHDKGLDALVEKFQTIWEPLYKKYQDTAAKFTKMMRDAAASTGHTEETGQFFVRTKPKGIKRIVEKAYYDGGVVSGTATMEAALADIKDVLAATFVVETQAQVEQTIAAIEKTTGITRDQFNIKDTINSGSPFGYRDIKLRIPIAPGIWSEVILITPSMLAAKKVDGHPWYELGRSVDAIKAEENGVLPESMVPVQELITKKAKEIYDAAWAEDSAAFLAANAAMRASDSSATRAAAATPSGEDMYARTLSESSREDTADSYDQTRSTYGVAQAPSEYSPTTGDPSSKLTNDSQSGSPTATASPGNLESLTSQNVEPGLMSDAGITVKENTVPRAERQPETLDSTVKSLPPNVSFVQVRNYNGEVQGYVTFPHDGTPEGIMASAGTAREEVYQQFDPGGEFSNIESINAATDENGKIKWIISPNLAHLSEVGTPSAKYTLGDLSAFDGMPQEALPQLEQSQDLPPNVSQRDMAGLRSRERISLDLGVDPNVVAALMNIDRIGRVGAKKTIGQINDLIAKREKELKGTGVGKINVSSGTTGPLSDVIKRIEQVRERSESLKATDALLYALMDLSGKSGMTQQARTFLESAVRALYQQQPALADVLDEIISQNPVAALPLKIGARVQSSYGPGTIQRIRDDQAKLALDKGGALSNWTPLSTLNPINDTPSTSPQRIAANAIEEVLSNTATATKPMTWQQLFAITDKAWGGTQANGTYTVKDAYDALELGINQFISRMGAGTNFLDTDARGAANTVNNLKALILDKIPTQTKRTEEQDAMQQFSTPPHFAYVADWVANLIPGDVVLEPSAGIGGIAIFAKKAGATVIANELSERRRAFLKELGFDHVTGENAEQLHAIYAPQIAAGTLPQPTVVVMNPPFSNAAKSGKKGKTIIGANHVEEGLKLLPDGGRLVAIVGEGMAIDAHHFRAWWKNIASKYNVRANILVDGKNYAKYGTTFSNRLLVIDKTGPTADMSQIVGGQVDEISQLPTLLEDIRNDRTRNTSAQPAGDQASQPGGRAATPGNPAGPATGETGNPGGPGGQPGGAVDTGLGGTPSASGEGTTGRPAGEPAGGSTGNPASPQATGSESGSQVVPSDPAQMSPEQAVSAFEFVRQKGQRTLMLRHGNTIHTFKQQKNGKLTAPKEEIIRGIHKALVTQRVEMLTRDRADASEGSVASTKNLARESLKNPARYNVSAAAVDAYGITLPEGYVRDGDLYVLPGATPDVASQESTGITITTADNANREIENEDDVFSLYKPAKLHIPGAQKHLAPLVESSAMASVTPPDPTYTPNLPKEVITEGRISETSLENIVYAGQAHKQILPNGERRGYLIGDGCVAKGTRIYNPITGKHTPIEVLMRLGKRHAVLALTEDGFVPRMADVPFEKGIDALFCVTLDDGRSITVTHHHRFLTPNGWLRICDGLHEGHFLASSADHPACNLDASRSTHVEDAPHSLGTPEGSLENCSVYRHLYGEQPRWAANTGQARTPSQADVRTRSPIAMQRDGRGISSKYTRPNRDARRLSRSNSSPSEHRGPSLTSRQDGASPAQSWEETPAVDWQSLVGKAFQPQIDESTPHHPVGHVGGLSQSESGSLLLASEETSSPSQRTRHTGRQDRHTTCLLHTRKSDQEQSREEWSYEACASIPDSRWNRIKSIEYAGTAEFFDMYVPGPENYLAEGIVNHNTGVGKGRQIAGVIMDNMRQGRTKAVWISEKEGLMDDAKRDAEDIGLDPASITFLGKTKKGAKIDKADGIIFSTYSTLKGGHDGILGPVKDWWAKIRGKNESRIGQLVNWLGKDFDGVIAFDEAHNAGNAIAMQGKRGVKKPSATGIAVVDLQTALPKARILYVSATAATEVENLSYADRLGIWGMGTPFPNKLDFFNKIRAGGISAMEIVARDLKAQGLYLARSISYKGVEFSRLTQELTPEQTGLYNTIAKAWQTVLSNVDQTMGESGANNNAMARSAALSAFWGAQQRFFNQLLTAMELPAVLTDMDAELAVGKSLVLQIVNTNEATQNRQIAQKQTEAGADKADLEDLDLSPRDILLQYLDKSFPTTKFEQVQDPNNPDRTVWQPARDSAGNIIQDPAAVATKLRLMDELALLDVPGSPLDQIIAKFGEEAVAEVTGRTQRVVSVKKDDGTRKTQIQRRGPSHRKVEAKEFQDGKRRILIFSDAGGTGFSFHASNRAKNKQRRVHYLVQAGWRADKALQGFGRTHRTDQDSPPIYKLAETNIAGHKRFISTIARRLSQLGALTTGERKSKGSGLFSETDNLESEYAEEALTRLIYDLHASRVENYTFDQFSAGLGFNKTVTDDGGNLVTRSVMVEPTTGQLIEDKIPAIPQFLNRVLALPLDEQNLVFDLFMSRLESRIKNAMDDGTYDPGTQSYKAEQLNKISDEVVFSQKGTGSKTRIVEIEAVDPIEFTSFDDIPRLGSSPVVKYVRNRKSGRLYALKEAQKETDQSGAMVETFRRIGSHTFDKVRASEITTGGTMVRAKVGDEITLEDGRKWKLTQIPSLSNPYLQVIGDITGTDGKVAKAQSLDPNTWSNTAGLEILAKQGGLYVQGVNHDADYVDPQGHYEEIDSAQAAELWQAEIDGAEKYSRKKVNFLVGAMLPVWDRIQLEHPKVYRFTTSEGEPMLGVLLPPRDVPGIRQRMGAKNTLGPQEVFDMARNDGGTFGLANGWSFRRVLVSGEHRIELSGLNYQQSDLFVNQMGGQMERIAFKPRHFIPTVEVMDKVLAQSPIITLNGQDIGNIPPPAAARRGISAQETPLIAFAKPAVANPAAMARFNDNLALATWFADKYRNIRGVEFEDLLQESRIGLWKAADRFEADRGIPFGAYASAVIRNRLNELYNRNNKHRLVEMTTLDAPIGDSADSATASDSVAARVEMFARPEDVAAINEEVANLPAKPRSIWEDFLAGMNWREIGTKYSMSHEGARKVALATGNTLRAALKKHGITTVDDVFPQKDAFNLDRLPERKSQIEDEENWSYDTTVTIPEETPDGVTAEDIAPAAAAKPRIDISAPADTLATNAGDRSTGMGQSDNAGEIQGGADVRAGEGGANSPQLTADAYVAWMGQKATDRASARLLSDPEKAFVAFANETGRVLPESWLKDIKQHQIPGGEEHWVYRKGDRVWKVLKPEKGYPIGGDPLEYVMKIGRMQSAAPQLDIRIDGILPAKGKSPRIVTSMTWVAGHQPTVDFLRTWLNDHGWTEVGAHGWLHEASGVEMADAAPDNFIQVDNDVVPIDVWFTGDVTKPMFLPTPPAFAKPSAKAELELSKIESEGQRARAYREDAKKAAVSNNGIGAQEFWKTHLSGRLDKLDFYAPGAKAAILDDRHEEALVAATINAMMDTMRQDIQKAFGYPKFWQKHNSRLQQFLDEILPTAARMEVSHLDDEGNFVFKDFQMRAGIIPFGKARVLDLKPGQKFMDNGELFTVGELVEGKGFVLLRDMLAEDQQVIFDAFHDKFPESAHYLDRFIMPGMEEARYMGPQGTMTAEFNRHALRALFNDWPQELRDLFGPMPLPDMPYVEGYTPDVAEQKTLVAMIGSMLRKFKSGARKFKAGEARESGNIKNLFDGFSIRAMEAHREKIRVQTRQKLIEAAAVPDSSIPAAEKEKYVPIDSTFAKLMESIKRAQRLDKLAFPALTEALSPADQRMMARILGDAYRLKGRGLMIHKEVERELMLGAARQVTSNALTKILAGLLERYNSGLLATPFTAITNWASNEVMKAMRVANRFNYAMLSALTGDLRGAKLGAYETGFLLRGFITDRFPQWQRQRIGQIVPRELFDDQTGLEAMDIDPNKSVWEQLQRLNLGGAFLKAIQYGEIDIRQKQQLAYAAYRAHAEIAASEAGIKGQARKQWAREWMKNAPAEIHRDVYMSTVLYMMDYQNVPAWLDPSQSNSAISQVIKRAIIPFAKWPYNMARQFKRFSMDSAFDLVMPGSTKEQRINGAANLMVMAGLTALGAWLVGSDDDDDKLLGSNVDAEGKLLESAFRTGNRINVSRLARIIFAHGLMRGATFSTTDAGGREEDLWWRYRNYPYFKEGILMGLAANGKWGEFGTAFSDISGEYMSLGLIAKVLGLSAFDKDKPVPYRTTEALYDVATSGALPSPWRQLAVKVADPVMRRSTPSESTGYGATALDAIKANTPGLSRSVPSVGQRKQVAFAPFNAQEWFRRESGDVSRDSTLSPQEKAATIADLRQQAEKLSLPALTQRDIFRDAGLPVDKMSMSTTSNAPAASDIQALRRMGVGPESYGITTNAAGQTRLTYPSPGTVRITKPGMEALRFFGGVNLMAAPRVKKQPLTAKDMFPDGGK